MNEIELKVTFDDFDLKPVKPTTNSSIVYVRKDWLGKTVNVIPIPDYYTKEIIEQEKHEDGYYKLIIYTNKMLQKVVKGNNRSARINLPASWLGYNVLIIESPND